MQGKLAIHGGPRTVPDGLKKQWPEITPEPPLGVNLTMNTSVRGQGPPEQYVASSFPIAPSQLLVNMNSRPSCETPPMPANRKRPHVASPSVYQLRVEPKR